MSLDAILHANYRFCIFQSLGDSFCFRTNFRSKSGVQQKDFGTRDGRPVTLYTLTNSHGVEVHAMNYGGIITVDSRP